VNDSQRDSPHIDEIDDPQVVSRLEALDDVIFPAIDGDEIALAAAEPVWKETLSELGPEAIQASRHQYLRHARTTWTFLRNQTLQHPHQILAVLKIITLLIGDEAS
jgi:hypothetical protein